MSTRGIADIVFVIDASASMRPCIDALRASIGSFVSSLDGPNAGSFDLQLEFIALKVDPHQRTFMFNSSHERDVLDTLYKEGASGRAKFWSKPAPFMKALQGVSIGADEDTYIALDVALDLPWREARGCHRVVVLLTDEAPETGFEPDQRKQRAMDLVRKMNDLRVKLFMVGPYSDMLVELQAADGADYLQIPDADVGSGLSRTDFGKILGAIAKSVSVSSNQSSPKPVARALFGQDNWGAGTGFDLEGSR